MASFQLRGDVREQVCAANQSLGSSGLVQLTWGNISGLDAAAGVFYIKPSGVPYDELTPEAMVPVRLADGGSDHPLRPSSDTKTHLEIYRHFSGVTGIAHTHSPAATTVAQLGRALPCYGTTHADHFAGVVPLARELTSEELEEDYERNTGLVIVETFRLQNIDPLTVPGVLLTGHAPFTWGENPGQALENSVALEMCARMALDMWAVNPDPAPLAAHVLRKHYERKHGADAYYGQDR